MKKVFKKILCISLLSFFLFKIEKVKSLVPYYYFPTKKTLEKDSLSIGKNAYELLYFGHHKKSLNLAKLALTLNKKDENLWLLFAETQIANNLYINALTSLDKAQKINSNNSETYFTKSNVYLKINQLQNAKISLTKGLEIEPNNYKAIFQLGNIILMEKNYTEAIKLFDQSVKIKPDFWQGINNQALAYFEKSNINLASKHFEKAISIKENAEPLLGLASCLRIKNIELAISLAKKALEKDPKYVSYEYRKEQLWGENLQASTEKLLKNAELQKDVILAKSKVEISS